MLKYDTIMVVIWMSVILPDDGNVIAETCSRDGKGTAVYTVYANAGSANKTHIIFARN
jgi:hypothetical protein